MRCNRFATSLYIHPIATHHTQMRIWYVVVLLWPKWFMYAALCSLRHPFMSVSVDEMKCMDGRMVNACWRYKELWRAPIIIYKHKHLIECRLSTHGGKWRLYWVMMMTMIVVVRRCGLQCLIMWWLWQSHRSALSFSVVSQPSNFMA